MVKDPASVSCAQVLFSVSLCGFLADATVLIQILVSALFCRVQQLQLLLRHVEDHGVDVDLTDSDLWMQLEDELELQRHKALVDMVRCRVHALCGEQPDPPPPEYIASRPKNLSRRVLLVREDTDTSMGLTVTVSYWVAGVVICQVFKATAVSWELQT